MKKKVVSSLFYALFLILGHGRGTGVANAQDLGLNINNYNNTGTEYASCDLKSIADKVDFSGIKKALSDKY